VRFFLAALSGVLFALAFPDYSIAWLSFFALAPLLIAVVRAPRAREAFLHGWLSMTVAWLMMVPWVVRVMSHYGGLPYVTGVLIFVAMSLYLGAYGGLFALLVWLLRPRERFAPWLLIAAAWAAVEYARTYLLTGFPWNLISASIADYAPLIQISRAAGPYFLGCLIVLPSIVIAWCVTQRRPSPGLRPPSPRERGEGSPARVSPLAPRERGEGSPARVSPLAPRERGEGSPARVSPLAPRERGEGLGVRGLIVIASTTIVLFVWWATGYVASQWRRMDSSQPVHSAALLQPNISQEMRWDAANVLAIYQRMMAMTDAAAGRHVDVII